MGGAECDRLNRGDLSSPSHTEMPVERSAGVPTCPHSKQKQSHFGCRTWFLWGCGGLFGLSPCYCVDTIHYSFRSPGGDPEIQVRPLKIESCRWSAELLHRCPPFCLSGGRLIPDSDPQHVTDTAKPRGHTWARGP